MNPTPPSSTPTVANGFQQPPVLTQIQTKVRRLTRTPSTAQLSDAELNNYINTFVVYDFPEQLRTFNLRTEFSFYTNPGQDEYNTDQLSFAGATNNILYNFQNLYLTIHPPVYIAGYQSFFSQSPQQFFGIYPKVNSIASIGQTGNGTAGPFTGIVNINGAIINPNATQNASLLQNNVTFSAIGSPLANTEVGMAMVDVPVVDPATGFKLNIGNLFDANSAAYQAALLNPPTIVDVNNNINYLTGAFTINFPSNTVAGTQITSQTVPMVQTLPQALMFYGNVFTVRPVPDQAYRVNFEVYQRPTALLAQSQAPELEEYWQLLAYGASIKILQDRMDLESVQMIMPEYNNQLKLCLRRTLIQNSNERTATIYTEQTTIGQGAGWGWGASGGPF